MCVCVCARQRERERERERERMCACVYTHTHTELFTLIIKCEESSTSFFFTCSPCYLKNDHCEQVESAAIMSTAKKL